MMPVEIVLLAFALGFFIGLPVGFAVVLPKYRRAMRAINKEASGRVRRLLDSAPSSN